MFTYELARRLAGSGVTATVVHPGMTNTGFSAEDPSRLFAPLVAVMRPFMRKPAKGAETPIYLASSPEAAGITGKYFADRVVRESNKASYDEAVTARLWDVSAALVGMDAAAGGATSAA
jgi:NAD(P)-dependent dehydrogenase (short-subunit alcohol dehydrogenase family)